MEKDISNYSSSSSHRLPTVSVSEALQNLASEKHQAISSGLASLDTFLTPTASGGTGQYGQSGGLARGHITEVYGPPGVGKTTMAMQAAADALCKGGSVVWIDCAYPLVGPRFRDILSNHQTSNPQDIPSSPPTAQSVSELADRLHHFTAPALAHLLALTIHPTPTFPPQNCTLLIIDSVSTPFATAYPRQDSNPFDKTDKKKSKKAEALAWAAARKRAVVGDFAAKLSKVAAIRNLAVLITSQTTTNIRPGVGAILHPAISLKTWDACISSRVVLFRDWQHAGSGASTQEQDFDAVRYAAVLKAGGVSSDGTGKLACFRIETHGFRELPLTTAFDEVIPAIPVPTHSELKRKRDEVADSESEGEAESENEFGWGGDEELLAAEEFIVENG